MWQETCDKYCSSFHYLRLHKALRQTVKPLLSSCQEEQTQQDNTDHEHKSLLNTNVAKIIQIKTLQNIGQKKKYWHMDKITT